MSRLRPGGFLTCFYCGKRSSTRFIRGLSKFDCEKCDATNYLDANGEITDPPVATEQVAPRNAPRNTASSRTATTTTTRSSADSIFCDTCLKNQRLFTASLAQYYSSEDPGESESEGLDRGYYKFRRGLEKRYPQVCDACADRVGKAIEKAGYTAKTDHLRKMMDRSREARSVRKTTTPMDVIEVLGKWLWWAGFALQMLWHLRISLEVISEGEAGGMSDPDEPISSIQLRHVAALLPSQDWLILNSLIAAVVSAPWNPHLVKVVRGFSRHLLGLQQWYSYQAIIIAMRFACRFVPDLDGGQFKPALLSAHVAIGCVMSLVYLQATQSIMVDTTPLFGAHKSTVSPKRDTSSTAPGTRQDDAKSFADVLNEALDSPGSAEPELPPPRQLGRQGLPSDWANGDTNPYRQRQSPQRMLNGLNLSESPARPQTSYEEMDWTPTREPQPAALPRAFKQSPIGAGGSFGQAPTHAEGGPFWYKVPQAPLVPAHRMRNPPNQPSLRSSTERGENIFFRRKTEEQHDGQNGRPNGGVSFQQPKFFANDKQNDEANSLADLLGSSFNMGPDEDDGPGNNGSVTKGSLHGRTKDSSTGGRVAAAKRHHPVVQIACLAGSLLVWLLSLSAPIAYTDEIRLGVLGVAGLTLMTLIQTRSTNAAAITAVEMALLAWLAQEQWWKRTEDIGLHGLGLLATLLGHSIWDMVF
jgi:hypothetical protein